MKTRIAWKYTQVATRPPNLLCFQKLTVPDQTTSQLPSWQEMMLMEDGIKAGTEEG